LAMFMTTNETHLRKHSFNKNTATLHVHPRLEAYRVIYVNERHQTWRSHTYRCALITARPFLTIAGIEDLARPHISLRFSSMLDDFAGNLADTAFRVAVWKRLIAILLESSKAAWSSLNPQ